MKNAQLRDGFDATLGDMAAMQTQPTTVENARMLERVFVEKENRGDFFDAAPTVADESPVERMQREHPDADLTVGPEGPVVPIHQLAMLMIERVDLLLSKPESGFLGSASWRDRALAVQAIHPTKPEYALRLSELIEASVEKFGPWDRKQESSRIYLLP